jgi:hypothetical protein
MAYQKPTVNIELAEYNELKEKEKSGLILAKQAILVAILVSFKYQFRSLGLHSNEAMNSVKGIIEEMRKLGYMVQIHGLSEEAIMTGKIGVDNVFISTI